MAESISKVRVYGKAQNRTVLGIVNAYIVMHPQTTADELRKAFPAKAFKKFEKYDTATGTEFYNDGSGLFHEIIKVKGKRLWKVNNKEVEADGFIFWKPDETIKTADGKELAMESTWVAADFETMVNWAKQYGIEVASFEKSEGGGIKGYYRLEYLNGYVPPKAKKGLPLWFWILLAVILAVLALLAFNNLNKEPEVIVQEKIVEKVVVKEVTASEIQKIEKDFNAAQFEKGKTDLTDQAKFVLYDLQKLMMKDENKDVKLKIVGHTSSEGDANFNQKLSEERAKAVVDFLVSLGVPADRLSSEGKGSSEPLDPNNQEVNRRTQIVVVNQ